MTTTATLSRGGESVSFPVEDESGTPLISRSFGLPNYTVEPTHHPNPRPDQRQFSGAENIRINTRLYDYSTALDLADLIKAHSGGDDLTLDIPLSEFDSNISVFPSPEQEQALTLEYQPGPDGGDFVAVSLTLSRVDSVLAGSSDFRKGTPRASGDGPITLSGSSRSVNLSTSATVERAVGRPHSTHPGKSTTNYPKVNDSRQSSYDAFDISLTSVSNTTGKVTDIRDMFRDRRGRDVLTLDFNGLYGMGSFFVMPNGSNALRHVRIAGRKGNQDMSVPAINLRVVLDDTNTGGFWKGGFW